MANQQNHFDNFNPPELDQLLQGRSNINPIDVFDFLINREQVSHAQQVRDVVPISEWVRSEYYLGDEARTLWKFWEDVIVEFIETNKHELILTGSLRSGKSNTALLICLRKLYELSCFSPIPARFGLSTSSLILFMYLSLTVTQAMMLGLGRLRRMIDKTPYFKECFQRDRFVESYIRFLDPSLVMIGGSELGHFKGSDLYFLVFDEANFAKGGMELKFQNAVDIYREATIRRKSTFMVDGMESGVQIVVSSVDTQSSFVEQHIAEAKNDPDVMVVEAVAYEVRPEKFAAQDRFWVFEGDDLLDPFIPGEDSESLRNFCKYYKVPYEDFTVEGLPARLRSKFRNPPVSFQRTFQLDIFGALKEVCGVSVGQSGRFFSNRVKFNECFPRDPVALGRVPRVHPFTKKTAVISHLDDVNLWDFFVPENCELNPNFEYFGGIDQSITDDTTGIALMHIDPESLDDLKIYVDFMLQIKPPQRPAKLSPGKITDFFIWLKDNCNVRNLVMGMDWYATQQTEQTFHMNGIDAEIHSVDRRWDDYRSMAGSILDNHFEGYYYNVFRDELFALVQDNERKKVDHPGGGSKDVADALTQAHRLALQAYLDIKGGLRYFPSFGLHNIVPFRRRRDEGPLTVGIYFGPEAYYAVWIDHMLIEGIDTIRVIGEYADFSDTNENRVGKTKSRSVEYGSNEKRGKVVYSGDPAAKMKGDVTAASQIKVYRRLGLPVRCRMMMDRESMDPIFNLIRDKETPRLIINEHGCPLIIRALRKAKYKLINNVKTGNMANTGEEFPVYALRFALEEAMSKSSVSGY